MKITPNQFAWIFLIVLLSLICWGGYKAWQFLQNPADHILSLESERKLGEMIEENSFNAAQGYTPITEHYSDSCIKVIHARLMDGLGKSNYSYDLKLVDKGDANAFAIPGGKIFIHSGLIRFCHSPEEVAAVLAHEMGHVERRHSVNAIVKQFGMGMIVAVLAGGENSNTQQISTDLISQYFSREDESEADDFALQLLEKSHIRPAILGEVFSRMKEEHGDMEGAMNLLSTHPELEQRASKSSSYVTSEGFSEIKIALDWDKLQHEMPGH